MIEIRYSRGRILDSIRFITEEVREFEKDYENRSRRDYENDRKLQKLADRTVENILTAMIEVCGTFLTEEGISAESYGDALKKTGKHLGLTEEEQSDLAKLALQRNRLAHRYLNFRWQAIRFFSEKQSLVIKVVRMLLEREDH